MDNIIVKPRFGLLQQNTEWLRFLSQDEQFTGTKHTQTVKTRYIFTSDYSPLHVCSRTSSFSFFLTSLSSFAML